MLRTPDFLFFQLSRKRAAYLLAGRHIGGLGCGLADYSQLPESFAKQVDLSRFAGTVDALENDESCICTHIVIVSDFSFFI